MPHTTKYWVRQILYKYQSIPENRFISFKTKALLYSSLWDNYPAETDMTTIDRRKAFFLYQNPWHRTASYVRLDKMLNDKKKKNNGLIYVQINKRTDSNHWITGLKTFDLSVFLWTSLLEFNFEFDIFRYSFLIKELSFESSKSCLSL